MANTQTPKPDKNGLIWVTIDDFRSGVWNTRNSSSKSGVGPAPLGSAATDAMEFPAGFGTLKPFGTYSCYADAAGSLRPFWQVTLLSLSSLPSLPAAGNNPVVTNLFTWQVQTEVGASYIFSDEIFISVESITGIGGTRTWQLFMLDNGTDGNVRNLTLIDSVTSTSAGAGIIAASIFQSRLELAGAPTGYWPCIIYGWANADGGGPSAILKYYPQVTGTGPASIASGVNAYQQSYGHQGRIVIPQALNFVNPNNNNVYFTSDQFNFTDPPFSLTLEGYQEIFLPEDPMSAAFIKQMDISTLLVVGARGSGFILEGDLAYPTVRYIPGIIPTGGSLGRPAQSAHGIIYLTRYSGAQVFGGGSGSGLLSPQLSERFWADSGGESYPEIPGTTNNFMVSGMNFDCLHRDHFVLMSGGWLFDETTNAFFPLGSTQLFSSNLPSAPHYFVTNEDSSYVYGMGTALYNNLAGNVPVLFCHNTTLRGNSFGWLSNPIEIAEGARSARVMEIMIEATGSGTIQAAILDDKSNVFYLTDVATIDSNSPTKLRMRLTSNSLGTQPGGNEQTSVQVDVLSLGVANGEAPSIHKIAFGYIPDRNLIGLS